MSKPCFSLSGSTSLRNGVEASVAHTATLHAKFFSWTFIATNGHHSVGDERSQFTRDFHQDQKLCKRCMCFSLFRRIPNLANSFLESKSPFFWVQHVFLNESQSCGPNAQKPNTGVIPCQYDVICFTHRRVVVQIKNIFTAP